MRTARAAALLILCASLPSHAVRSSPPAGPTLRRLTDDGLDKQRPAWSADGKRLAFARHERGGSAIWQYVLEVGPKAAAKRLTDRKAPEYNGVFSPDGRQILLTVITLSGTQGNLDIAVIGADGQNYRVVATDVGGKLSHQDWPSWSADGKRFAFSSTHDGNQEIYTADLAGGDVVRLTQSPGHDAHPCWSPDGGRIAFATDRWGGGLELASVKPDGTGLVRLTDSRGMDDYPAYSPDGSRLAWVSNRDGNPEVYVAAADGSDASNLTQSPTRDAFPAWHPADGSITFVTDRDGATDLYAIAAPR